MAVLGESFNKFRASTSCKSESEDADAKGGDGTEKCIGSSSQSCSCSEDIIDQQHMVSLKPLGMPHTKGIADVMQSLLP